VRPRAAPEGARWPDRFLVSGRRMAPPSGESTKVGDGAVRPGSVDEWTHYLYGPGNNAVAQDNVVGPPRHLQWVGGPAWTRNHHKLNSISSVVTAKLKPAWKAALSGRLSCRSRRASCSAGRGRSDCRLPIDDV